MEGKRSHEAKSGHGLWKMATYSSPPASCVYECTCKHPLNYFEGPLLMEVWSISHTAKEEFVLSVLTICHTEYMYEIYVNLVLCVMISWFYTWCSFSINCSVFRAIIHLL